jgi:hypothetical protein
MTAVLDPAPPQSTVPAGRIQEQASDNSLGHRP